MLNFNPLKIEDKALFEKYATNRYINSESSFANMFAWRKIMKTEIAYDKDNLYFLYTKHNGMKAACFPKGNDIYGGILKLKEHFEKSGNTLLLESITKEEAELVREMFSDVVITEDVDLFDYVYDAEKLRTLSGKKLHSKRNHINKFLSLFPDYKYEKMTSVHFEKCINCVKQWLLSKYESKENQDYIFELSAISEFINHFDALNLSGGILSVDDNIVAFTIGEKLNDSTCVVHIEKADTSYEGAYTMINNLYIKNEWPDIELVNREEDMGIDGLRRAKRSYYPEFMVEKFIIKF